MGKIGCSLCLVFLLLGCWGIGNPVNAQQFSASYQTKYQLGTDGLTRVRQEVALSNLTEEYYANEYSLVISSSGVEAVTAQDEGGEITPQVEKDESQVRIRLLFNQQVIGKDKTKIFTLKYQDKTIAQRYGSVWEVLIPRIERVEQISDYQVSVEVPLSYGALDLAHPQYDAYEATEGTNKYHFNYNAVSEYGVLLRFGETQYYDVKLKYHLQNPESQKVQTQIALPPDVPDYQEVIIREMSPHPKQVELDEDGNYLATYHLNANERIDVTVMAHIKVHPNREPRKSEAGLDSIPTAIKQNYTKAQAYWPVDDDQISQLANTITSAEASVYAKAKLVYDYVTSTLTYNPSRAQAQNLERLGALEALNQPDQAVCTEFSDLFIALARSIGIPAREIAGYAFTTDDKYLPVLGDVLHSWVEVYIPPRGWVSIDPTWGSTTKGVNYFDYFDTNHVYFAIRGLDSTWPYPAGAYKLDPDQLGDMEIKFLDSSAEQSFTEYGGDISVTVVVNRNQLSGLPVKGEVLVKNVSGRALRIGTLELHDSMNNTQVTPLNFIAPYGHQTVAFTLPGGNLLDTLTSNIYASVNFPTGVGEGTTEIAYSPLITYVIGGCLLFVLGTGLYVIWRKRKDLGLCR